MNSNIILRSRDNCLKANLLDLSGMPFTEFVKTMDANVGPLMASVNSTEKPPLTDFNINVNYVRNP